MHVPLTVKQKKDALSSHENPSGGKLILGHASPLNAFLLTHDERHIVSADRDEHIRISCYPKGYNIEMYCLGHRKCVTNRVLLSGFMVLRRVGFLYQICLGDPHS